MATFTSSLPDDLLQQLAEYADRIGVAKNKIIEKALRVYLDQITRTEYAQSYRRASQDADVLMIAEEGVVEYFRQINSEDEK
ncbi:MAG: ribbon-helix-helix domain-containing protein [Moheibacter sp.]